MEEPRHPGHHPDDGGVQSSVPVPRIQLGHHPYAHIFPHLNPHHPQVSDGQRSDQVQGAARECPQHPQLPHVRQLLQRPRPLLSGDNLAPADVQLLQTNTGLAVTQ